MRWMIEIGRVDIATEVSMLSSFLAMSRVGPSEVAKKYHGIFEVASQLPTVP